MPGVLKTRTSFLVCLTALVGLLLLPCAEDLAWAKKPPKPPKPTPTPVPEPDHDPDLAYSGVRRVKGRNCSSIYTIKLDGSHKELFVDCGGYRCTAEEWSPDGSMLAFSTHEDVFEGPGTYVINVDGTGLRRIVADGFSPTWARGPYHGDGPWIAFANHLVEPRAIYVVKVQGPGEDMNTPIPLVESGADEDDPLLSASWSADGKYLIVTAAVDGPFGWHYEIVYGFDLPSVIPKVLSEMNVNPIDSPPDCPLYGPKFSPVYGDNRILIAGCNQTYLVYFVGEDPLNNPGYVAYHLSEFITDHNVDDPYWSPNATLFTFNARTSHASWGIFTMPLDPYAVPVEIVSGNGNGVVYKPKWRPR